MNRCTSSYWPQAQQSLDAANEWYLNPVGGVILVLHGSAKSRYAQIWPLALQLILLMKKIQKNSDYFQISTWNASSSALLISSVLLELAKLYQVIAIYCFEDMNFWPNWVLVHHGLLVNYVCGVSWPARGCLVRAEWNPWSYWLDVPQIWGRHTCLFIDCSNHLAYSDSSQTQTNHQPTINTPYCTSILDYRRPPVKLNL